MLFVYGIFKCIFEFVKSGCECLLLIEVGMIDWLLYLFGIDGMNCVFVFEKM